MFNWLRQLLTPAPLPHCPDCGQAVATTMPSGEIFCVHCEVTALAAARARREAEATRRMVAQVQAELSRPGRN